tara:strand:+ start:183 stop:647 length:465 start_codon:yes stop_codon:yes gene_type:complete
MLSGCGTILNTQKPTPEDPQKISPIKKVILKKLDFLPFIEYVPSVKPTPSAKPLLDELFIYESIVDDHVDFELIDEQNDDKKGLLRFQAFLKRKNRSDSIEEKLEDIMTIRILTKRYENWSVQWDATSDIVGKELSLDEIDLIKSEIKRISRKL